MNKLTKQLLSLGLSVVTVAGMVLPVFAEEVDETLENITPIAKFQMKPMRIIISTRTQLHILTILLKNISFYAKHN